MKAQVTMTESTDSPFISTPGGPKIILLDLQGTLAMPPKHDPSFHHIRETETYKEWLMNKLPSIQQSGWEIHIFTVRSDSRREATLASIERKSGWKPDAAWFKHSGMTGLAPDVKSTLLNRLIKQCRPSALYAFESNSRSRKMFNERDVPCQKIASPEALEQALLKINQIQ